MKFCIFSFLVTDFLVLERGHRRDSLETPWNSELLKH